MSLLACLLSANFAVPAAGQIAVRGGTVYTMAGEPIKNGMIVVQDGKITAVGKANTIKVPAGFKVLKAKVVTPGLIDAHCTVGLSGILNYDHDQDQLEHAEPIQPELRALDAYNAHEDLVAWVRSFGVTTIHTGHAPGELISGQTLIVKTTGNTVEGALLADSRAVVATLTGDARKEDTKSPGTRGKMIAMLREQFIKAQEYLDKKAAADGDDEKEQPARDLRLETLGRVLKGELALIVTAHRAQDIGSALRLAEEFDIKLWLDGAAEAYLLIDEIKAAGVPVLIHPTMVRPTGERENFSFETASKLVAAGVPVAMQAGYEAYVPKTRVLLWEAAMAAANGLSFEQALASITVDSAKILGINKRVGSLEVGKDGDLALFDGDPFEYTSHCIGVVINGEIVSQKKR
ncbi:MAG: amidohydrolase [Planctomycetaceae bacterium]|nr:amidohydrolase [Planctomycetaceae bacterium]